MKFRPGYLALAPLAPLGAAVAHAVLMPKKKIRLSAAAGCRPRHGLR